MFLKWWIMFLYLPFYLFLQKVGFIADKNVFSNDTSRKRLVHLTMRFHDDDNFPWGGEPVLCDGTTVGMTTSASYGFQGNKAVAMARVDLPGGIDDVTKADFQVNVANKLYPVDVGFVKI